MIPFSDFVSLYYSEDDHVVLDALVSILTSLEEKFPPYRDLIYKFEDKILAGILEVIHIKPQKGENPSI